MQRHLRVTVEIDPDSEPIRGIVCDDATARSFTGWMQLVTCAPGRDRQAADIIDIEARTMRSKDGPRTVKKLLVKPMKSSARTPAIPYGQSPAHFAAPIAVLALSVTSLAVSQAVARPVVPGPVSRSRLSERRNSRSSRPPKPRARARSIDRWE